MKARRAPEIFELIQSPDFQEWWSRTLEARTRLQDCLGQLDELESQATLMEFRADRTQQQAVELLQRSGGLEDTASQRLSRAAELENKSYKLVSDYEEMRFRCSELWYKLGTVERHVEEATARKASEAELATIQRNLTQAKETYEKSNALKESLWAQVESLWSESARASLLTAEERTAARLIRDEAESVLVLAQERKVRVDELRRAADEAANAQREAELLVSKSMRDAEQRFECIAGKDYLYFRTAEDTRRAYCVALKSGKDGLGRRIQPLDVYSVDRQRGVELLETVLRAPGVPRTTELKAAELLPSVDVTKP